VEQEIDTNSVAPGMGKQPTAKVVNTKPIPKLKENPLLRITKRKLILGLFTRRFRYIAIASKSIYDTPPLFMTM
jgi:hypothetical protein